MDLLALLRPIPGTYKPPEPGVYRRQGLAEIPGQERVSGAKTKVSLWRMSGSKVWEVEVDGLVYGLAWSRDGKSLVDCFNIDIDRSTPLVVLC